MIARVVEVVLVIGKYSTKLNAILKHFKGVFICSIFAIFSFGLHCCPRICPKFCSMPIMNEHPYQDDFRRALSKYAPQISSPTITNELPPTESTVDHIQFGRHMEAPVAEAIAQNVPIPVRSTIPLTHSIDPYTDPYEHENGSSAPVRPNTIN